ncbi:MULTISPECIES: Fic family protein [Olivibacter]|uniref:Fic family protein n=1 Tax=Olivibacter oleidegradans TaxID=760123 RepID=A0ABV6HPD3_9SPHI
MGNFTKNYLSPAIEAGFVALPNPDNPTSSEQRYTLTALGKRVVNQ